MLRPHGAGDGGTRNAHKQKYIKNEKNSNLRIFSLLFVGERDGQLPQAVKESKEIMLLSYHNVSIFLLELTHLFDIFRGKKCSNVHFVFSPHSFPLLTTTSAAPWSTWTAASRSSSSASTPWRSRRGSFWTSESCRKKKT